MVFGIGGSQLRAVIRMPAVRGFKSLIDIHPTVQRSLQRGEPVVALESTIITHGMPHPQNLETAQAVEQLVRDNGALPATIAVIDGRLKVGLGTEDLVRLASKRQQDVIKCSRRDLPYLVAKKLSGGTTVAATMIIAHMAGIKVFATGGVGGVHREGHITMDVSADLIELGRTPVTVISSGVKSILDIPRTLEYLETQGVCVATYGDAEGRFPDFYTRDSGCKVPYNLAGPAEAARLIRAVHDLGYQSGVLIGVPVPEEFAVDKQIISAAIEQANLEARKQEIRGKQLTPFLLSAIAKITEGNSLQANMALVKNNATVAAQIARELCGGKPSTFKPTTRKTAVQAPLVIGASILDLSLTMLDDMPKQLNGATYNAHAKQSPGGVGRNIAEGVLKLYGDVNFISMVGNDHMGKSLLQMMPQALRAGVYISTENTTSLCSVIFDKVGDCKLILGNMEIHDRITPQIVRQQEELIRVAPLIVMDSNLPLSTTECILALAQQHNRPVFLEPTDMNIAGKPYTLPRSLTQQIRIISPNIHELKVIVQAITKQPVPWEFNIDAMPTDEVIEKAKNLLAAIQQEFDCILLTLGHHGVLFCGSGVAASGGKPLFDAENLTYAFNKKATARLYAMRFYPAPKLQRVTNVSGAGDSFSSGFITGLLRGFDIRRCVAFGFIAAERALQSHSAVPSHYFSDEQEESQCLNKALEQLKEIEIQINEEHSEQSAHN